MSIREQHVRTERTDRSPAPAQTIRDASGYAVFSKGEIGAIHVMAHQTLDRGQIELGHRLLGE